MTSTNQSLGLTIKFTQATNSRLRELASGSRYSILYLFFELSTLYLVLLPWRCRSLGDRTKDKAQRTKIVPCEFSGDFVDRVTPVPIPNTEVKPVGADGTARVTVWESRKSPGLIQHERPAQNSLGGLFVFIAPQ